MRFEINITEQLHAGEAEPLRHWGACLTKIWPGEARLTSFCHSISIYTSIYCHLWGDILDCKLKKHYDRQSKCGDIIVWRRFFYSEIRVTGWLLWHSDFTKFNYRWGSLQRSPNPIVGREGGHPLPIPHHSRRLRSLSLSKIWLETLLLCLLCSIAA